MYKQQAQFILQPQYTDSQQNICEAMHLMQAGGSPTDVRIMVVMATVSLVALYAISHS